MRLTRQSKRIAALIALVSLLFAHGALAFYQCPGDGAALAVEAVDSTAADAMRSMPGCDGTDIEQPALCQAHGQVGKQSLDKPAAPDIPPFMASGPFFFVDAVALQPQPMLAQPDRGLLARSTAPPLAIRNCCFRI